MNNPYPVQNSFHFNFATDYCNAAYDFLQPTVYRLHNEGNYNGLSKTVIVPPSNPSGTLYLSDESKNPGFCLEKNEQSWLMQLANNNEEKEDAPSQSIRQENEHHDLKKTSEHISSERIEVFAKEATIQSQKDRLFQLPTFNKPDDLKLISFLEKLEKQTEITSSNPHEPAPLTKAIKFDAPRGDNLRIAAKSTTQTFFPPVARPVVGEDYMETDNIVSDKSNSCSAKLNSCNISLPIRPLSAYNYFFADERERFLSGKVDDVYDEDKKQRLLLQHLTKDRSKPRQHRKAHGKINFASLSRMIGQRWKKLPEHKKRFYKDISAVDWTRFRRELNENIKQTVSLKPDDCILAYSPV